MKNRELADLFYEVADVLEMQGVDWKPAAYRRAARSLESLSEPVEKVYSRGIKALMDIPGVGRGIALKIEEFLNTGKIREFDRLAKKVPGGVEKMMHVPGLGPKKVMRFYRELKIRSVHELERAVKSGRLRNLRGFGVKSEEDILRGLNILKKGVGRFLLGDALPVAQEICSRLLKVDGVESVEPAGSLRRMNETVGDIDILVISRKPAKVMDFFTSMPEVKAVLAKGLTKSSVILKEGIQSDVRVLDERSFGAALQYFTGSKEHNVALRQIAVRKGYKLSEYGLFSKNRYICGKTEKDIYSRLGLSFVPPELRENHGEIEAALRKKLPHLVSLDDIKGDLQMHSKWSDGSYSIEEMARAAERLGYKYIAITDHSKSEHIANGMDEKRLLLYLKEIDRVQKKVGIHIFKGSEVDILADGSLDYDDKYLKMLDFVLVAVHSRFKSSSQEMTRRILKAFDNPYVNVFAHPTGRLINRREPYEFDFDKVALTAKERGIALEANAYPDRLDLNDVHIRKAVELGCKISLGTDSHSVEHLHFMRFGVAQARRGWAECRDVINSLNLSKLERFLRR